MFKIIAATVLTVLATQTALADTTALQASTGKAQVHAFCTKQGMTDSAPDSCVAYWAAVQDSLSDCMASAPADGQGFRARYQICSGLIKARYGDGSH